MRADFMFLLSVLIPMVFGIIVCSLGLHNECGATVAAGMLLTMLAIPMLLLAFDVSDLVDGRAHYELRDHSNGTRAWVYVENKKGN